MFDYLHCHEIEALITSVTYRTLELSTAIFRAIIHQCSLLSLPLPSMMHTGMRSRWGRCTCTRRPRPTAASTRSSSPSRRVSNFGHCYVCYVCLSRAVSRVHVGKHSTQYKCFLSLSSSTHTYSLFHQFVRRDAGPERRQRHREEGEGPRQQTEARHRRRSPARQEWRMLLSMVECRCECKCVREGSSRTQLGFTSVKVPMCCLCCV